LTGAGPHSFPGQVFRQITDDFAIAAESDILVPLAATDIQGDLIGNAGKDFLTVQGGHVSLVAGRESR
jgi:hypothetical protein